jgi:hypothetical protein
MGFLVGSLLGKTGLVVEKKKPRKLPSVAELIDY